LNSQIGLGFLLDAFIVPRFEHSASAYAQEGSLLMFRTHLYSHLTSGDNWLFIISMTFLICCLYNTILFLLFQFRMI